MRTRTKIKVMFGATAAILGVGLAAWAQNLNVAGTTTGQGSAFFATTSGNVGIGTTNPLRKLEVNNAMRLTNSSADANDGVIGTAPFAAGLNIVGINTDGGGRKVNWWGSFIQNENAAGNSFIGNTNFPGNGTWNSSGNVGIVIVAIGVITYITYRLHR